MHFFVVESIDFAFVAVYGYLGVQQLIVDAHGLGVLVYSGFGGFVEHTAVRRQGDVAVVKSGFADFEAVAVRRIRNAEHID